MLLSKAVTNLLPPLQKKAKKPQNKPKYTNKKLQNINYLGSAWKSKQKVLGGGTE